MASQGLANTATLFVLVCASFVAGSVAAASTYSVVDYGAKGDGTTDDTNAFLDAWSATCQSSAANSVLIIPAGKTFLLSRVKFEGPCKSSYVRVQVDGNIVRPSTVWDKAWSDYWIFFNFVDSLTIIGSGQLDGQGAAWWSCKQEHKCPFMAPAALLLLNCNRLQVDGLKLINSPAFHLAIGGSDGVTVSHLTITAPGDSPNTDGIHIQNSRHVVVSDSTIGTGDDCVSISDGAYDVKVISITCGPGHGISIGSLGQNGAFSTAEQIHVDNCNIFNTMNGVRIKTWQGGSGYARGISFQNINFTAVQNPIIIDQYYCPHRNCPNQTSALQVSDVKYIGVMGTSSSKVAIQLSCSQSVACQGIAMQNVNIQPAPPLQGEVESFCYNVQGTGTGTINPAVPCLTST